MSGNLRCIRGTSNEMYINEKENNKKDQKNLKNIQICLHIYQLYLYLEILNEVCEDI